MAKLQAVVIVCGESALYPIGSIICVFLDDSSWEEPVAESAQCGTNFGLTFAAVVVICSRFRTKVLLTTTLLIVNSNPLKLCSVAYRVWTPVPRLTTEVNLCLRTLTFAVLK